MRLGSPRWRLAMRIAFAAPLLIATAVSSALWAADSPTSSSPPSISAPQFDLAAEYRKGVEALKASQFSDAKKAFAHVLSQNPRDAATNFLAGMADAGLNDLKGAQKHYEKAVKADGKLVAAQKEFGVTSAKLGDRPK